MKYYKRLKLWLNIRWNHVYRIVDNAIFDLRLKYHVRKYGGGDKIPPEVVGKLMGEQEDPMLVTVIFTNRVCGRLKIEAIDTMFFKRLAWLINNSVPSVEDKVYAEELMKEVACRTAETNLYAIILRELVNHHDIEWHQIPHRFAGPDDYDEFKKMCGM